MGGTLISQFKRQMKLSAASGWVLKIKYNTELFFLKSYIAPASESRFLPLMFRRQR